MEVEQMDIEENLDYNILDRPNAKSKRNKKTKINFNIKKFSIFSIFLITIFAFIILYNIYPKVNYKEFSLEKNEKDKSLNQECDIGYKLVDGKCVINYSFKAEYDTFRDIEQVELIKEIGPEAIKELIIDGFEIRPVTKYIFQKKGPHTVYMLLDMDKI